MGTTMNLRLPTSQDLTVGAVSAIAVTGELMVAGALEADSPWAPLNTIAPLLLTPEAAEVPGWDDRITPVGLGITLAGIAGWATLHRCLMQPDPKMPLRPARRTAAAVASAAALALFDYHVLPPARRPRFSRWLSSRAVVAKYATLAAVLAASR
jgi:hypothetical protein